jgi:hypothetical protein
VLLAEPVLPEVEDPELAEPEVEVPVFGVAPGVPGRLPQGELLGVVPGVEFGFMVEGCVVLPGVGDVVEFAPGTGGGVVGVAVFPGGVAVPGVFAPGVPGLPAGAAPPAGALCATTHTAQARTMERKVSFVADI